MKLNKSITDNDIANILMFTALFWTLGSLFFGVVNQKIPSNKPLVIISAFSIIILLLILELSSNYCLVKNLLVKKQFFH